LNGYNEWCLHFVLFPEMQWYTSNTTSRYDNYHGISFMIRYVSRYTALINKSDENNKTAKEYIQYIM
jgi:hypothetical protein